MSNFDWNDETPQTDGQLIEQQVAAEMIEDLQEAWQAKAAAQFPDAAHLSKHWRGNTKQEVLEQAKAMSESLKQANPGPSVTGGSPALGDYHPGDTDEVSAAMEAARRNPTSNKAWSDLLRAKAHAAGVAYIDE